MKRQLKPWINAIPRLLTLLILNFGMQTARCADLLQPSPSSLAADKLVLEPEFLRIRAASVDLNTLDGIVRGESDTLELNLFDDEIFPAAITSRSIRSESQYTLQGILRGIPSSDFIIVRYEDAVSAVVRDGQGRTFSIRGAAPGIQKVISIDTGKLPACTGGIAPHPPTISPRQTASPSTIIQTASCYPNHVDGEDGSEIDIMMLYTADVLADLGSIPNVNAEMQLTIDNANLTFTNSNIQTQFQLVLSQQVVYTETGSFSTELGRLAGDSDGFMDTIHTTRDTVYADLVALIIKNGTGSCGIGYLPSGTGGIDGDAGFSVSDLDCLSNFTFVHEAGHNMGCAHDRANASNPGVYQYSYGYDFTGGTGYWGTVMSYLGTRVQHFSNPLVIFDGAPSGSPEGLPTGADNAQSINHTRVHVANFRKRPVDLDIEATPNSDLTGEGGPGGPFQLTCESYTLTNNTFAPVNWIATWTEPWLSVTPNNGSLAGSGGSTLVDVCFDVSANALPVGIYRDTVDFDFGIPGIQRMREVTLRVEAPATFPLLESFETGFDLAPHWSAAGTNQCKKEIMYVDGTPDGTKCLAMYDAVTDSSFSFNDLILTIDLSGQTQVDFNFSARMAPFETIEPFPTSFTTFPFFTEGVAISEDGVTWYTVNDYSGLTTAWNEFSIDLDAAATFAGISFNNQFKILFRQVGFFARPDQGIDYDKIEVIPGPNDARQWELYQ